MRRYLAQLSVITALAAGLGCQHIGGKCDCGYSPSDYPIMAPTNPHASAPVVAPAKPAAPKTGNE
ncbi:hypothetical protein R5W23_005806 [Gemmata sp. JC673]|uniref:Lipoprotein n=1 Tax=Gemmata algarum TaxID=2975278 RepID=A0ABU5EU24_9BACT|nr:hypothetical protein [Gemmata algarum]MDY3558665.1 hypothetical protein [Gemmata algarum]